VTPTEAVAFVQKHGVVLESANGQVPSLAQAIIGDKIKGSWWAHPRGKEIFQITRIVRESDQVLVCRLISGKVTLVHRRLWPALVRCAKHFRPEQIAQLVEQHTPSGKHVSKAMPFPGWVPSDISAQASTLDEESALDALKSIIEGGAGAT
jgi:hypothetical protein